MRIGLMVGSDKERSRADRLAGLLADGKAAEDDGFASFWIPQVPGYLDAMTAVALLGQVTERIEIGTAVVPIQTRHPHDHGAAGADHPGGVLRPIHARHRAVAPLDHLRSARAALRAAGTAGSRLPRRAERGVRRSRRGGDRQRQLLRAQPDGRHRRVRDADAARRAGADDAADRRRAHRRNHPLDGRRARHRRLRGPAHHRGGRPRSGRSGIRVVAGVPVALCSDERGGRTPARTPARCSGTPTSPPTTCGCSSTATPRTSATPWPQETSATVLARLRRYRDAGVTDLAVRVVPLGDDAAERSASRRRTQEFVASLVPEFASGA